jgi:hypothetical protein
LIFLYETVIIPSCGNYFSINFRFMPAAEKPIKAARSNNVSLDKIRDEEPS